MAFGVRAPFKLPIKQKHFRSVATNVSGEQLDQLAKGEVWVQNPLHRAKTKSPWLLSAFLTEIYQTPKFGRENNISAEFCL